MKKFAAFALVALAWAPAASAQSWTLGRARWAGAGDASQVVSIPAVRQAVAALAGAPGARLAVVHNGGEDAVFWASDLEGWLIALGVPAARIEDRTASLPPDRLRLEIVPAGTGP